MKILYHTPTKTLRAYPRQDNEPIVGLDPAYQVFDVIQEPKPQFDPETQRLEISEVIDVKAKTVTRGWTVIERKNKSVISVPGAAFFQAIGRDLEIRLRAKIAEETDLNKRHFLSAFMSYPYFESNHPMVLQFGALLGKTPEEIRGYFEQAKSIAYP